MNADETRLLVELVEKVGLLRRDLQHRKDLAAYEARISRIDQKLSALVAAIAVSDAALAKALDTAWRQPARSLAFRNAAHQQDTRRSSEDGET